jgi:hypothetical protein
MPPPLPTTPIPFVRHDARRGMLWLRRAYSMFRAAPWRWLLLIGVYYGIVLFAELGPLPAFGKLAAGILKPVFAVGFLAAAWGQERGGKPALADLFRGFRSNLWALLPLGMVFFVGMTVAFSASALVDDGALLTWASSGDEPSDEVLATGRVQLAILFAFVCALPTLLALWFAPALVVFHGVGAPAALAASLRAALANWRAVAVFGLAILFYGGIVPWLGSTLARLLDQPLGTALAVGGLLPYMLVFLATFQIADYVAYRDVFHADEPLAAADDQAG